MLTQVTDLLLEKIETYLSPTGRLYLVALDTNDPQVTAGHSDCLFKSMCAYVLKEALTRPVAPSCARYQRPSGARL
jgi:hypothetical protein